MIKTLKNILLWAERIFFVFFGSLKRAFLSVIVIMLLYYILVPSQVDPTATKNELTKAINLANDFEKENRRLKEELNSERRLRVIAEQTTSALSEQVLEQDEELLNNAQQIAFYRQLLQERDSNNNFEIVIRSFEIVPDFRENSYQLLAVLNRGGAERDLFKGDIELNLSLRDENFGEYEYTPVFDIGSLNIEFRYYIEIDLRFNLPPGSEILNGQLVLRNEESDLVASRILHDQVL